MISGCIVRKCNLGISSLVGSGDFSLDKIDIMGCKL